jgi:hypothetical protein
MSNAWVAELAEDQGVAALHQQTETAAVADQALNSHHAGCLHLWPAQLKQLPLVLAELAVLQ